MNNLAALNLKDYELIVFDLDNTLAPSKTVMDVEMAFILENLLKIKKVAVISGGSFTQFQNELLTPLSSDTMFSNLHLFPMDGTAYYKWDNEWKLVYIELLSEEEKLKISKAFAETFDELGIHPVVIAGDLLEDRQSSVVFSALGQKAPLEAKLQWDPERKIRLKMKAALDKKLPEFEVNVAGTTSIDITAKGKDKAYGIKKMVEYIKVPKEKMVFVGDALFPGGNDHDVIATGIKTVSVKNPDETKLVIKEIF